LFFRKTINPYLSKVNNFVLFYTGKISLHIYFWQYGGLNSWLHICEAGALLLEPYLSLFDLVILEISILLFV
jgi:hypothetical protein